MFQNKKNSRADSNDSPIIRQTQYFQNLHKKTADYLNRRASGWSPGKLKVLLLCFCFLAGSASLFVMAKAVLSATGPPTPKVQQIKPPILKGSRKENEVFGHDSLNKTFNH